MERDTPSFGILLKGFRRRAHLTQEELAERAAYSFHYVSMLERGVRLPPPVTIDLLADALNLPATDRTALHTAARRAHPAPRRVPVPVSPPFGRQLEKKQVIALLQRPDIRILTMTGPGGVGKTRLAEDVVAALGQTLRDGAVFIDLAVLNDPESVPSAIAQALMVRSMPGESVLARLIGFLRERDVLVFLDSFERVQPAAPVISALVRACPRIKFLVTSRTPLRVSAEQEFPLQPLILPEPDGNTAQALLNNPAVALFVQRARLVKPSLATGDDEIRWISEICRQLDGLPLAIELAAARLSHLPLPALRDRLENRLEILTGGPSDWPIRQRRMRDTIAWSYDLLTAAERSLFRQLSVLTGGWSLEAAEAICVLHNAPGQVLDGLRSLVDASLILFVDMKEPEPRYRMLDTIQEFGGEQLSTDPEVESVGRRHAEYFLCLAEQAEPALQGTNQDEWYRRLGREKDNLRTALRWFRQSGDDARTLRLAAAIWRFWQRNGYFREGRRWLDDALATAVDVPAEIRSKALWGASWLAFHQGDYKRSHALSVANLALARASGDLLVLRNALTGLGMALLAEGHYVEAVSSLEEALKAGMTLGKTWHAATSFLNLGIAVMHIGDFGRATALFNEAAFRYRDQGDEVFGARVQQQLGYIALEQGDVVRARMLFTRSLEVFVAHGEQTGIADALESMAAMCAAAGHARQAVQLVGTAASLHERLGMPPTPYLRSIWHPFVTSATERLSAAECESAREEGRAMSLEQAIAIASDECGVGTSASLPDARA